jgi:hypothetical protein
VTELASLALRLLKEKDAEEWEQKLSESSS